jgi:hypothetical protein
MTFSHPRKPHPLLICKHCSRVYENCVITADQHRYCTSCAASLQITSHALDQKMNAIIDNLEVFCKNKRIKCVWKGTLSHLKDHLRQCPCKLIPCGHCSHVIPKALMEEHLKKCIKCETCEKTVNNMVERIRKQVELVKEVDRVSRENKSLKKQLSPQIHEEFDAIKLENFNLTLENRNYKDLEKKLLYQIYLLNDDNTKLKGEQHQSLTQISGLRQQIGDFKNVLEYSMKESSQDIPNEAQLSIIAQLEEISDEKDRLSDRIEELMHENEKLKKECILVATKNSRQFVQELEKYKEQAEIYKKTIEFLKQEITKMKAPMELQEPDEEEYIWKLHQADLSLPKFSPPFTLCGMQWRLQLNTDKKQIGFTLYPKALKMDVKTHMYLSVKTEEGPIEKNSKFTFGPDDTKCMGWAGLIKRTDIKKLFKENAITVHVKVKLEK